MKTDTTACLDYPLVLESMENSDIGKLVVADAIDRGHLLIFNAWDNQVQVTGTELTQNALRYDLGTITFLAFDMVHNKWFLYRKRQLADIWSQETADHFADNQLRHFHKAQ